jgi:hypothetical protein
MKILIRICLFFIPSLLFAECPQLSGNYDCDNSSKFQVVQKENQGFNEYEITNILKTGESATEFFRADGQEYPFPSVTGNGKKTSTCETGILIAVYHEPIVVPIVEQHYSSNSQGNLIYQMGISNGGFKPDVTITCVKR